jgi:hypothetical protein
VSYCDDGMGWVVTSGAAQAERASRAAIGADRKATFRPRY